MSTSKSSSIMAKKFKNTFYEKPLTDEDIDLYEQQHQEQKVQNIINERQEAYEIIDNLQIEMEQTCHTTRPTQPSDQHLQADAKAFLEEVCGQLLATAERIEKRVQTECDILANLEKDTAAFAKLADCGSNLSAATALDAWLAPRPLNRLQKAYHV